jgi:hypothetical protein
MYSPLLPLSTPPNKENSNDLISKGREGGFREEEELRDREIETKYLLVPTS